MDLLRLAAELKLPDALFERLTATRRRMAARISGTNARSGTIAFIHCRAKQPVSAERPGRLWINLANSRLTPVVCTLVQISAGVHIVVREHADAAVTHIVSAVV